MLSASLRAEDDCKLASALQVRIDVVVRDKAITAKPQNVNVEVIECLSLEAAVSHADSFKPQIIYVKTYAEATKVRPKLAIVSTQIETPQVADKLGGAPVWGSRLPVEQKNQAIAQFEAGNVSDPNPF